MTSTFMEADTFRDVRRAVMGAFNGFADDIPRGLALSGLFEQALTQIADGHPEPADVAAAVLGRH